MMNCFNARTELDDEPEPVHRKHLLSERNFALSLAIAQRMSALEARYVGEQLKRHEQDLCHIDHIRIRIIGTTCSHF